MSQTGNRPINNEALSPRGYLRNLLDRPRFNTKTHNGASTGMAQEYLKMCRVLIIGAGGLGCELLKDLSLMGFIHIDIVDMDTIEISNLNRQFLFKQKDIGQPKAEVAAAAINKRVAGVQVKPHFCRIQDKDEDFYREFHVVVAGLDSVPARRWLNGMLISLLVYENGILDESSVIPLIDGGTEGLKGNTRVILPGISACFECTIDLYPPQVTYPLCTIANTPRLPEHCIEFVKIIEWPKENPFKCSLDLDDPVHINWVLEKSQERASRFGIRGVDLRLVQGVLKNIIPAVASTNAVIAAACSTEVFKLVTGRFKPLANSLVFNNSNGIYTYSFKSEKKEDCLICSQVPLELHMKSDACLEEMLAKLCLDGKDGYGMKNPGLTAMIDGKQRTLYISTIPSIERQTRDNLKKSMQELGLRDGSEIVVADETAPLSVTFRLKYK